jgi:hypothetical protein
MTSQVERPFLLVSDRAATGDGPTEKWPMGLLVHDPIT